MTNFQTPGSPFGNRKSAGAPIRRGFIERADDDPSPLGQLLSGTNAARGGGGRGGRLRIALLITLIWQLAKSPHTTTRPARYWAELLGLEDPEMTGARSIRNTLHELERRGFIRSEGRGSGLTPTIVLLDETLQRVDYKLPYLQAQDEGALGRTSYFRVPESFWAKHLASNLSGAGLAMYLIAMARAGWGDQHSFWLSPKHFRDTYGLGDSTRKKGLKELVEIGVLTHQIQSLDHTGQTGHRRRQRSVYTVTADYLSANATELLSGENSEVIATSSNTDLLESAAAPRPRPAPTGRERRGKGA